MKLKPIRIVVSALVVLVVLVASACGGGSDNKSVPSDAVAVVDGTPVTKAQLDSLLQRAKLTYKAQKRAFPKAGTSEYQALQTQAVAFLVQRAEYDNRAADMKLSVSDKDVQNRIAQIKKASFGGSEPKFAAAVKAQGYTMASLRTDITAQLLSEKIYDAVTKDAKVTPEQIKTYYNQNKSQFTTPESRDVRHILVKTKAQANKIYNELKNGASFAALAKKYSQDPGSKDNGGKLTISRGQTVAPFDQTAFNLSTNVISRPIKTQYGYHVIEPISDVRPPSTTSLKDATPQIESTLLEKAKNDAITQWTTQVKDYFAKRVSYATGYAPPAAATTPTTTG